MPLNIFSPGGKGIATPGFQYARIGYAHPAGILTSNVYDYHFSEIANLAWLDAKYTFVHQPTKPWVAVQGGIEHDVGGSVIGSINSKVVGAQIGAVVAQNFTLAMSYNFIPRRTETRPIPPGSSCNPKFQVTFNPGVTVPFFLPLNAPQCVNNGNGTATYFFGGIASPYTDTFGTDPLFTTSLTQGMVDRRAPGDGFKIAVTYTTPNKRLIVYASRAYYNYGFFQGPEQTNETDADALWYAQPLRRGPYKGLLLRYRYGARVIENTFTYGGLPLFKYNRAQLEYDF
jgi:hypothetical protein